MRPMRPTRRRCSRPGSRVTTGSRSRTSTTLSRAWAGTVRVRRLHGPGWKRATPLAVPTTWEILRQSVRKSSDGLAHVTPNRVIVSAQCRPADDPDFPPVMFLNGHYPLARTAAAKQLWKDCQSVVDRARRASSTTARWWLHDHHDARHQSSRPDAEDPSARATAAGPGHRPHQRHPRRRRPHRTWSLFACSVAGWSTSRSTVTTRTRSTCVSRHRTPDMAAATTSLFHSRQGGWLRHAPDRRRQRW